MSAPSSTAHGTSDHPGWEFYSTCIHCGLCLNACPTYRVLGTEMDSPRGRIYQVAQVDQGKLPVGDSFVTHIDRCLDCRACESACPSGVEFGRIVERARAMIEEEAPRPWHARMVRKYVFTKVLGNFRSLSRWARLLRFYQQSGLQRILRKSGVLRVFGMESIEALSPTIDDQFYFDEFGLMFPATGERRGCVAFLAGCVASVSFSELNCATVRVLQANGVEVWVPKKQGCCGALQAHAGFRAEARRLARVNINAMLDDRFDAIVTNAAGCGSTMKEYGDLLASDTAYSAKARYFASKVRDVTEYLEAMGLREPSHKHDGKVTYQDPCHLAHGQKVRSAPRELLKRIGAEIVEMPHSDHCCGSAGSYNVTQNELSMKILDQKMDDVGTVPVEIIATGNVGCMLQLRAGIAQRGLTMGVKHVIELLDECY